MTGLLLLHLLFQAALGWEVRMPKDIHGLQGSCLVIPCSFSYTLYPPKNPRRVVWYQWVPEGYPLVYDPWNANEVIEKFRGTTDLYGNSSWDCSLLIRNLEQSHHGEKIYTWIDPENVGWRTYKFYDVTSTILVDARPQPPSINIYGGERPGETITVVCSAFHTCPYSKPNLILNGIEGSDQIDNEHIEGGLWKISLTRTGVAKAESSTTECSVTYYGGITVVTMKEKTAQASVLNEQDPAHSELKNVVVHILAPLLAVFLLTCIIAGFIIYKRRQQQPLIGAQESHTQLEERRSHWNTFSRRFIRSEGRAAWNNRGNRSDTRTKVCAVSENKPFSKPRMPSPKSEQRPISAEYTVVDDLGMYGNIL
ncbi:uncharacterized protein si:ch73-380l3.3 isoform X2 [Danio rerio]|uniref:Uncharacterized protein si:ch73-380l3.3 isoform X2 n=1 Tax=Danio rerio TaxID=7955 RepID=A0AC58HDN1_DANRE|nr:uncharacterized protein si:ch73-380l3.3 isoform X2 [Danio rerio]|eukprot:XP_009290163.1 uncharacterized protein si:ch73-380l3.3 isoform X2 [Danio rerio]